MIKEMILVFTGCMLAGPLLVLSHYGFVKLDKRKRKTQFSVTKMISKSSNPQIEWVGAYYFEKADGSVFYNAMILFDNKERNVLISEPIYHQSSVWLTVKYIIGRSGTVYIEGVC